MKKLALIATLAALGLASCTPSAPASSSVEPEPTTSSESPSSSSESPSSSSTGSSESTEKHDGDFTLKFEDFSLPNGDYVGEQEYYYLRDEAVTNVAYVSEIDYDFLDQVSNYELLGEVYGPYRSFEEEAITIRTDMYDDHIIHRDSKELWYHSGNGGHYGGWWEGDFSSEDNSYDIHTDEWVYNYADSEGANYVCINYDRSINGESYSGTLQEYSSDDPAMCDWYSDYYYRYADFYDWTFLNWQYVEYDPANTAYVLADNGDLYQTNIGMTAAVHTETVGTVEKQIEVYNVAGTRWVFRPVEGIGYTLYQYSSFNMDYVVRDLEGNLLDAPIVTEKRVGTYTISYAATLPAYEGEALAPIEDLVNPYSVSLDVYADGAVSEQLAFEDITGYYRNFVDPEYDGFVFRANTEGMYYGDCKVSISSSSSAEYAVTLGWKDLDEFVDLFGYAYASETLEDGIYLDYVYFSLTVMVSQTGEVEYFAVNYLYEY